MIRIIDGQKYLMRDQRPVKELRALYRAFTQKYYQEVALTTPALTFHRWLVERGKVYVRLQEKS